MFATMGLGRKGMVDEAAASDYRNGTACPGMTHGESNLRVGERCGFKLQASWVMGIVLAACSITFNSYLAHENGT